VAGAAAWAAPAARAAAPAWHFGPLNPAFVAYEQQRAAHPGATLGTLVPLPVNPRPWAKAALRLGPLAAQGDTYATSYDPCADSSNVLPAVRDQGSFNDCWAFASLGSLEFSLLPAVNGFSEDHLAVPAGTDFDYGPDGGGNYQMATAELARWNGPVAQASDPNDGVFVSGLPAIEHVQNVIFLPDRSGSTDNDAIKAAVLTYGAVFTGMYADPYMSSGSGGYYNPATCAYYYNGSADPDHAVDIVGWDDNYPATNFKAGRQPASNGAFIVRNSWGTRWGDGGYFYVSYDDRRIASTMAVFTGEATSDYAQNLGHDRLGFTDTIGYGDDTAWMAAGYTVKGDSALEAASFYAQSPGTTYDVYVGSDLNDPTTWTAACSGTIDAAGYHTVAFDQSWAAQAGVKFYVIVRLTTPTTTDPIPLEDAIPGYSSKATTAAGQSYASPDGSPGSWDDIGVESGSHRADVCLKVFAGQATPDPIRPATRALAAVKVVRGHYATLRYRVNDLTPHDIEKVTIKITKRSGNVVKSFTVSGCTPNTSLSLRFRCLLARAGYHYCVYATDRWGNTQTSVGRAALTVR
jgi:C1A family cysteine protease